MIYEVNVMGKYLRLLLVMVAFITCFGNSADVEAAKKTVAVTGVENNIGGSYAHKAATDLDAELTTVLVQCGMYNVVERGQLEHVVRELGLHTTGLINGKTAIQFGQMTGADYSVIGNVVAADVGSFNNHLYKGTKAKIKFNFKFVDNKTGMIKIAEMLEGTDTVSEFENKYPDKDMMLGNAAKEVAEQVLEKINAVNPIFGNVLRVTGNKVYFHLGSNSGVRKGETFVIYREGELLMDPVTGDILGVEEEIVGSLKVEEVKPQYSVGKIKNSQGNIDKTCKVKRG